MSPAQAALAVSTILLAALGTPGARGAQTRRETRPAIRIPPPGRYGNQYSPGVNPKDAEDSQMRADYIAAIQRNRERIETFGRDFKLHEAQQIVVERAARSLADAHRTLRLDRAQLAALLDHADIMPADRASLLAAIP